MMAFAVFATLYELFKFITNADGPTKQVRTDARSGVGLLPHNMRCPRVADLSVKASPTRRSDDVGALHLGLSELLPPPVVAPRGLSVCWRRVMTMVYPIVFGGWQNIIKVGGHVDGARS